MPVPTPEDLRHESLEPYLQRLRAFLRARGDENRPLTIPCEPTALALSAEERRTAWAVLCGETVTWAEAGAWIPLGAALHLAVVAVLTDAVGPDAPVRAQRLAAVRPVAAGYTEALREVIAARLTGGDADEAKRLSSFRNKLHEILTALRAAGAVAAPVREGGKDSAAAAPPPDGGAVAAASPEAPAAADPALAPYLRRAAAFLRARGREEKPLTVRFGRRSLALSVWERRVLWRMLCEGAPPTSPWHRLIPESVAVQLALLQLLDELEEARADESARGASRAGLIEVVSLAAGVVEGFRAEMQRAVATAALEDAKQLSALSGAFGARLIEAKRALAQTGDGAAAADGGGPGAGAPPDQPAGEGGAAPAGPPEALKPFLDRASHLLEIRGHDDRPVAIPVGDRSWNLDSWERQVLWKVWCEEGPPPPDWAQLLGHCAAAQLAALLALERLRRAGGSPDARAAAETERETAIALAVEQADRLRATAEALTADGQVRLAERLMRFQAKLADPIDVLKRTR